MHREITEEYRHTEDKAIDLRRYAQQMRENPATARLSRTLSTDFAWVYCCAAMCKDNCGYPILIEFSGQIDPVRKGDIQVDQGHTAFHAVPTWWNGDIYAVYTNFADTHTDPVLWERNGTLYTGVNNKADPDILLHIPPHCPCHPTSFQVITTIAQGMSRIRAREVPLVSLDTMDKWVTLFRIEETLSYLDMNYFPFARAIATQLIAGGITKPQEVAYLLFGEEKGEHAFGSLEAPASSHLPSSIDIRKCDNIPCPRTVIVGEDPMECKVAVVLGRSDTGLAIVNLARINHPSKLGGLLPAYFKLLREPIT
jgi:hypothetical protein